MMYIVSKDKRCIINTEHITSIYIGADNRTIKTDFSNGKGCQIGIYSSETTSRKAIEILAASIDKVDIVFMPDDDAVNTKIRHSKN